MANFFLFQMILQFLDALPQSFADTTDVQCATGAAMLAAHKLVVSLILLFQQPELCHIGCWTDIMRYLIDFLFPSVKYA